MYVDRCAPIRGSAWALKIEMYYILAEVPFENALDHIIRSLNITRHGLYLFVLRCAQKTLISVLGKLQEIWCNFRRILEKICIAKKVFFEYGYKR